LGLVFQVGTEQKGSEKNFKKTVFFLEKMPGAGFSSAVLREN